MTKVEQEKGKTGIIMGLTVNECIPLDFLMIFQYTLECLKKRFYIGLTLFTIRALKPILPLALKTKPHFLYFHSIFFSKPPSDLKLQGVNINSIFNLVFIMASIKQQI